MIHHSLKVWTACSPVFYSWESEERLGIGLAAGRIIDWSPASCLQVFQKSSGTERIFAGFLWLADLLALPGRALCATSPVWEMSSHYMSLEVSGKQQKLSTRPNSCFGSNITKHAWKQWTMVFHGSKFSPWTSASIKESTVVRLH